MGRIERAGSQKGQTALAGDVCAHRLGRRLDFNFSNDRAHALRLKCIKIEIDAKSCSEERSWHNAGDRLDKRTKPLNIPKLSNILMIATGDMKVTHNEVIKQAIPTLAGQIRATLDDTALDRFSEDDGQFLKFHGIYQQDDRDLRKTGKKYMMMI